MRASFMSHSRTGSPQDLAKNYSKAIQQGKSIDGLDSPAGMEHSGDLGGSGGLSGSGGSGGSDGSGGGSGSSGGSGSGKTSVCRALLGDPRVSLSISATTRPLRVGERHGVDYFFHDRATFERMLEDGEFVEWAEVYGHLYGTPMDILNQVLHRQLQQHLS